MVDHSSKRVLNSLLKSPNSAAASPETPLNSAENESNYDIDEIDVPPAGPALPAIAANGVEWFPVPGWNEIQWLWHGFSARRGGATRSYCAEQAPGELNLGFTTEDDRANVIRNRQLLAEAVTGDSATHLVTLRQIHSSVVVSRNLITGSLDSVEAGAPRRPPRGTVS